jgi:glycerol-3-phosphate acyltransferase PlsY
VESLLLAVVPGYLLGSLPTAQLAALRLAGVDLRRRAGTISGSALYYEVARWAPIPVGLIDVTKGAAATALPLWLGESRAMAVTGGVSAVVGHNWSIWLAFRGGRGLSPFLGMLVVLFPAGALLLLLALGIGRLLRQTPVVVLVTLALLPGVILAGGGGREVAWGALGMFGVTVAKRLEANRRPLPSDPAARRLVLWRRLWLDRDTRAWPSA